MIDLNKAKSVFDNYLKQFDLNNDKINLKLIHTYEVINTTEYICEHENIVGEQKDLACLIALLHDIGRFEQIKRFNSFDDNLIDHGVLGVKLLFEEGMIKDFIDDRKFDLIIKEAIENHSLYSIKDNISPDSLKQALLIRDSDKLDNFRVKNIESINTLFSISEEEFLKQNISSNIKEDIKNHHLILKDNRHNEVDMWVSYMAFIFDLNFEASYQYLKDTDYISRNMNRFNFSGKLKEDMKFVEDECNLYINNKIKKK